MDEQRSSDKPVPFVPDAVSDSSITSLAELVRDLPADQLREGIQEQLRILEQHGVDLENFANFLAENLWSDRQTLEEGLAISSYSTPTVTDILKVRLLGLYQVGFHPEFLKR